VLPAAAAADDLEDIAPDALPEWDGVEKALENAPLGIDINVARPTDLMMLPGIGASRAQAIIEHRAAKGPFGSIYELAALPGFGPGLFRRTTGLSMRRRVDRHLILAQLLPLPPEGTPLLTRITEAVRLECGADGAVLTSNEGVAIAVAGAMPEAQKYAALGSRYFFRTRRQLQKFVDRASDCIILPGSTPPLLLLSSDDAVIILTLSGGVLAQKRLNRVRRAMREIGWLLTRRAVVFSM
jgi:hypothetical protein